MLYILHGADREGKKVYVQNLSQKLGLKPEVVSEDKVSVVLSDLTSADLFASVKLYVLNDMIEGFLTEESFDIYSNSPNHIIFNLTALDKRTKLYTSLKTKKNIFVRDFEVPEFHELSSYVQNLAQVLGLKFKKGVVEFFIQRLGYLPEKLFSKSIDTGRVVMELEKLKTFSGGNDISEKMVEDLVSEERESVGFAVTNALSARNNALLSSVLKDYFGRSEGAEAVQKSLMLTALLGEQFRSMWVYLKSVQERVSEEELLRQMSWKSGKLYSVKRTAEKFSLKEVENILEKLELLDLEQKTTTTPPRVIVELILSQI